MSEELDVINATLDDGMRILRLIKQEYIFGSPGSFVSKDKFPRFEKNFLIFS